MTRVLKQDPRTEFFDKPILVTQGFDASYLTDDQFNFDKFKEILNRVFENDTTDTDDSTKKARDELSLLRILYEEGHDNRAIAVEKPHHRYPDQRVGHPADAALVAKPHRYNKGALNR